MNVFYLCKRQYMGKDVLDDRYGRMYEIPLELSRLGVTVRCFSLSYRSKGDLHREISPGLYWDAFDLNLARVGGLFRLVRVMLESIKASNPVAIIATSDILHLAVGEYVSRRTNIPLICDLYDNFESYGMSKLPFMNYLYRKALRKSSVVTCVSVPLSKYISKYGLEDCQIEVIENAVDHSIFKPFSMQQCRRELSLPENTILIGTAGALNESRDIGVLYKAFEIVQAKHPLVHLVLAGKPSVKVPIPEDRNIHYLGELQHDRIACFYNALDLAVVPLTNSAFGRYCYPQKACEILACKRPLVASSVGVMRDLLRSYPECLFDDGDAEMLAERIIDQIDSPRIPEIPIHSWAEQSEKMKQLLDDINR